MIMVFLTQMRQSNGCGSVTNDEISNLHLGSGVGPWVSIPCGKSKCSVLYKPTGPKPNHAYELVTSIDLFVEE